MAKDLLPRQLYILLFSLLAAIYLIGLFVPLMDNDSAHHANIALHMYLTGDYVSLIDYGKDYLDKPHLHFWLAAMSYKIFGVTGFAYKLPSFLFTILGVYSTFQLGKRLYDTATGKLAALILASSFAFILANNDVRMDAILTSCVAFSLWQLVAFIDEKKIIYAVGIALGLALGFSTKGHIAVFVPAVAGLAYILYKRDWKIFLNWQWLVVLVLFALFIFPVVYCYYLQYNLHPEKIVRGKNNIDGVKFILLNQSVERFSGEMGSDAKNDYLFFFHSFLWAFAPWSIICFIAVVTRIKTFAKRTYEWMTLSVFIVMALVVTLSGFKLPHYLNIIFPSSAVLVSSFIISKYQNDKWIKILYRLQLIISICLLLVSALLTFWAFPVKKIIIIIGVIFLLSIFFYLIKTSLLNKWQKSIAVSVSAIIVCFFLLNLNFYPQLLKYQGGNELAFAIKNKIDPNRVYFWDNNYSSSFNFYTKTIRKELPKDSILSQPSYLLFDVRDEEKIKAAGYEIGDRYSTLDYEITKLDIKFINPVRRESQCTQLILAGLIGKR